MQFIDGRNLASVIRELRQQAGRESSSGVHSCTETSRASAAHATTRDYDTAIPQFLAAIAAAPRRTDLRKDLAYTYLKIGEPTLARDQFHQALTLDPADTTAALEYAFLCNETHQQADGSVYVPKALRPYLGGRERIEPA